MGKAHSKGGLIDDSSDYHRRSFVLSSCSSSLVAISLLLHELPLLTGDFCHSPYKAMELQDLPLKSEAADTKSQTEYTNSRLHETSTRIHPVQSPRCGTTKQTAAGNIISMDHGEAQEKEQPRMPAFKNRPARYMILLVLLYDILAIFAWVIPCILTKRPVTTTNGYSNEILPNVADSHANESLRC